MPRPRFIQCDHTLSEAFLWLEFISVRMGAAWSLKAQSDDAPHVMVPEPDHRSDLQAERAARPDLLREAHALFNYPHRFMRPARNTQAEAVASARNRPGPYTAGAGVRAVGAVRPKGTVAIEFGLDN